MLTQLEEIKDTLLKYFETRIDLFKIEIRDKIEQAAVMAIYAAALLCIGLVILILIVILLGTFLNRWLDSDYLGYLILLAFFVILMVAGIFYRKNTNEAIRKVLGKIA